MVARSIGGVNQSEDENGDSLYTSQFGCAVDGGWGERQHRQYPGRCTWYGGISVGDQPCLEWCHDGWLDHSKYQRWRASALDNQRGCLYQRYWVWTGERLALRRNLDAA